MNTALLLLKSTRVKALLMGFALATIKKVAPDLAPHPETMNWLYATLLTFIGVDTLRPVDPSKPGLTELINKPWGGVREK